jgi:hypothetical protein
VEDAVGPGSVAAVKAKEARGISTNYALEFGGI